MSTSGVPMRAALQYVDEPVRFLFVARRLQPRRLKINRTMRCIFFKI
jgi:hypothetical protein